MDALTIEWDPYIMELVGVISVRVAHFTIVVLAIRPYSREYYVTIALIKEKYRRERCPFAV